MSELTEANYSTGDYYHYTYDEVGNRLTEETNLESNTYVYDDANRLASVNTVNYTFDDNGNLLDDGVNTYTYDSANRLTTVSGQSSTVNYAYNGFGDRLSQTVDSVTTNYTLDLNAGLTQVLDDGENIYTYGLGRISQTNVTTEYFLGDALGSVRQLTDSTGDITLAKGYDPYGVVTYTTGASQTEYGFTGEQYSVETQMLYLRARYYNPLDGRFISRDTWDGNVNNPLSLNRWNYVESNPVNYVDPTGHISEDENQRANQLVENLEKYYDVHIEKDWGYVPRYINLSSILPIPIVLETFPFGCNWQSGNWDMVELRTIREAVHDLAKVMNSKFTRFIGETRIRKAETSHCGSSFRGCTYAWGSRDIVFKDAGTPPVNVDISNDFNFDKWTVVHEFGHAWDRNYGWSMANLLMAYTGGYIGPRPQNCDTSNRLPGCNNVGYFYSGPPPAGSGIGLDAREDFAESVAAFVYPREAQSRVAGYMNDPLLRQFLFYSDYTQTSRWKFINGLINLGVLK